jgi:serine/threonine protein phosphatase PrpC
MDGVARVCGVISTSRSLGDAPLKRFVIPDPDVGCRRVRRGDDFLIIGTDGLWDYISTAQVAASAPLKISMLQGLIRKH